MILLDSHVLVWAVADSKRLSKEAAAEYGAPDAATGWPFQQFTTWEIAWMLATQRVQGYGTIEASVHRFLERVTVLPITEEIASLGAQFPVDYPRDQADRLIGGTARAAGLTLVTRDERIRRSPLLKTVW